jgi:hypothetical protein
MISTNNTERIKTLKSYKTACNGLPLFHGILKTAAA